MNNDLDEGEVHEAEKTFEEVDDDYDALIIPGGTVGSDTLRLNADAVDLLQSHVANGKPVAAICHGPWLLVEANAVNGRTLTSYPSLETDIRNAGGEWADDEVVHDSGVVTSRRPDDLDAFCDALVSTFSRVVAEH